MSQSSWCSLAQWFACRVGFDWLCAALFESDVAGLRRCASVGWVPPACVRWLRVGSGRSATGCIESAYAGL